MSKGLEALERLTKIHNHNDFKECYKIIEKDLKALEIIKSKKWLVDTILGYCAGCDSVNGTATYDLLKEVLYEKETS